MSRRSKVIIAVLVVLALLLLGLWWWLSRQAPAAPVEAPAVNAPAKQGGLNVNGGSTVPVVTPTPTNAPAPTPAPPKPPPEANLSRLAAAFAERFGSFSNVGGDFSNIEDLKAFMSAKMIVAQDAYIAAERAKPVAKTHYGITTRAINETVKAFDDAKGSADIVVKTQRQEFIGNTPIGKVSYQDIDIVYVKENGQWKVDSATWK